MLLNRMFKLIVNRHRSLSTMSLHLFATTLLLSIFIISASWVRADGYYSDSWVDDSDPDHGYIVGVGVTEIIYGRLGPDGELQTHEAASDMTITSPNGRTATVTAMDAAGSYSAPYHAAAEGTLAWDWEDLGDYTITTRHYSNCPYQEFGSSSVSIRLGRSEAVYQSAQCQTDGCLYTITPNCETTCKFQTIKVASPSVCHSYAIQTTAFAIAFGTKVCLNTRATIEYSQNPGTCHDYGPAS
jgi:hypothetical protein